MYKNKIFLFVLSSFLLSTPLTFSQNNTNSPYTRFGYGDISETNSGEQRAMGGVGLGARSSSSINTINPASYSSVDSMTFMFDVSVGGIMSRFTDKTGYRTEGDANLEYISMQFPLSKWLGFSAGLLPYSFSGYNFYTTEEQYIKNNTLIPDTVSYTKSYSGSGGFSQMYGGLSAKFLDHVSLGINAYYMYGTINNYRYLGITDFSGTTGTTGFTSSSQTMKISANNLRFRFGAQFYNTFAKKHDVSLGLIYEQKKNLNGEYSVITTGVLSDTINSTNNPNYKAFELPTMFGAGFYYTYDQRMSLGVDYTLQKWGDALFKGTKSELNDRSRIAVGAEYLPNPKSKKFFERVRYRAGFNLSDCYYKVNGTVPPQNYAITFGVGLPFRNSVTNVVSMVNASFEYGKTGKADLLREDYFKFSLNVAFKENWFFKRKL